MSITTYGFGGVGCISIMGWGYYDEKVAVLPLDLVPQIISSMEVEPFLSIDVDEKIPQIFDAKNLKPSFFDSKTGEKPNINLTLNVKPSITTNGNEIKPSLSLDNTVKPALNFSTNLKPGIDITSIADLPVLATTIEMKPSLIKSGPETYPEIIDTNPPTDAIRPQETLITPHNYGMTPYGVIFGKIKR